MNNKTKKIVLIVGASSSLGRAAGLMLARAGYFVGVNDWAPAACEKVVREIKEIGGEAAAYPADPSKKLTFQTALEHFLEEHGKIDLLVNTSAIEPRDKVLEMDEWDWRRALNLNLSSVFVSVQSVGRVMRDLGSGTILNLVRDAKESSSFAYRSAVASIQAFSNEARKELAQHNIQVVTRIIAKDEADLEKEISSFL